MAGLEDLNKIDFALNLDINPFQDAMRGAVRLAQRYGDDISRKLDESMIASLSRWKTKLGEIRQYINDLPGKIANVVAAWSPLGAIFGGALGAFTAKNLSDTASQFEEMASRFKGLFGTLSAENQAFVDNLGATVGRSRIQLMDFMGDIQTTFTMMGLGNEVSASLSQSLTQLAVDFASFHNASDSEVMQAFRMALMGNERGLRRYGVALSDAAISQELLRLGVMGGEAAATQAQLALARFNALLAVTQNVQGAAVDSMDAFASVIRTLQAEVENLSIEFGQELNTHIVETVKSMGGWEPVREIMRTVFTVIVEISKALVTLGAEAVVTFADWVKRSGGALVVQYELLATMEHMKSSFHFLMLFAKAGLVALYGLGGSLVAVFESSWNWVKAVTQGLVGGLAKALEYVMKGVSGLAHGLAFVLPKDFGGDAASAIAGTLDTWIRTVDKFGDAWLESSLQNLAGVKGAYVEFGTTMMTLVKELDFGASITGMTSDKAITFWEKAKAAAAAYKGEVVKAREATVMGWGGSGGPGGGMSQAQYLDLFREQTKSLGVETQRLGEAQGTAAARANEMTTANRGLVGALNETQNAASGVVQQFQSMHDAAVWMKDYHDAIRFTFGVSNAGGGVPVPGVAFSAFAHGGQVFGRGGRDRVPAMLTAGEHVVHARAARANRPALEAMNRGEVVSGGGATIQATFNLQGYGPMSTADAERLIMPHLARLARQGATTRVVK